MYNEPTFRRQYPSIPQLKLHVGSNIVTCHDKIKKDEMAGTRSVHNNDLWRIKYFVWPTRRERLGDFGLDGRIILKRVLKKWGTKMQTGLVWLRTGTAGEALQTR
jgi:hypothetical protein